MDKNRFSKVAEYLADRYVTMQEEKHGTKVAANDLKNHKRTMRTRFGEDAGYEGYNTPLGVAGGIAGTVRWRGPEYELSKSPFQVLNNPELQKRLTNPYEKFVSDLLLQQEHVQGGKKQIGNILHQFRNPQNLGSSSYRSDLMRALDPLVNTTTANRQRWDSLILDTLSPEKVIPAGSEVDPKYWDTVKTLRERVENTAGGSTVPRKAYERMMSLADSLRDAKTPDAVKSLSHKLRQLADTTSYDKAGKPSGYSGRLFDDVTRKTLLDIVSDLRRSPNVNAAERVIPAVTATNLSKVEDMGRALGKITNSVNTIPLPAPTSWAQRFSRPGIARGAAGAVAAGFLPRALDLIYPNKWRSGFIESPVKK
jgi:hypothetical protein